MGKYLRPRRGNENDAFDVNIKLLNGEMFLEYPEGVGIGKGPGRIVIGNGNDTYREKSNASTIPGIFKPFITDPSLYIPIYDDTTTKENYKYEDDDRGKTILEKIKMSMINLPQTIGFIKEALCRHTDNLRYDNYRLNRLEAKGLSTDILDIQVVEVQVTPSGFVSELQVVAPYIEGWDFFMWNNVSTKNKASNPVYFDNPTAATTFLRSYIGQTMQYNVPHYCYALFVKRNTAE